MYFGNVNVDVCTYLDLNEYIHEYKDDVIKLFTDYELTEELQNRSEGNSEYKQYNSDLYTYVSDLSVDIDPSDVIDELDNCDLKDLIQSRGLSLEVDLPDVGKYELKEICCRALGINEYYPDEEILEMLKQVFSITKFIKR